MVGGLVLLARTIDKARAVLSETQGNYKLSGISIRLLDALGIGEAEFMKAVRDFQTDEGVAQWVHAHSDPATYDEINATLSKREITPERRPELIGEYKCLREDPQLTNVFQMLDIDDRESFASTPAG
ncbi:MAG: DUF5069 domain-containing protein [Candidatus Eremiobacteraeota bacterium]|nr:DUF5069 domain-containing protein [Candidatus Eremiobacteraeota bacterium]